MKQRSFWSVRFAIILLSLILSTLAAAQKPAVRITQRIDPNQRVTLHGNIHPMARAEFDRGPAPDSMIANRMLLVLSRSDQQEKALQQLLDDQQVAGSPNFHKWLTPEEFGQQFGPSDVDVQTVTTWLLNNGFQVTDVAPGRNVIEFSGTAGQLRQIFHADIHKYVVNGEDHWANADDPQIPVALAPVVKGITSLNNFPRRSQAHKSEVMKHDIHTGETTPLITTGGSPTYYPLGPADFSVIYGSNSLLQAGTNGTGQTIAIVGRTNINLQDVTDFRALFGLSNTPDNHTSVILNGPDPGINDDAIEALLDVEWAGAVAPGASVVLVASESTTTADGIDLSSLYIVEHNLAPVMSASYGSCEAALGNAGNLFYQTLWQQAAAQGITVIVSAGDSGSAGCDNQNLENVAQYGIAVNGLASTPFNIAIGGTDFNDATTQSNYFNSTNTSSYLSAKSYVPEMTWNDTCAGGTSPSTTACGGSNANLQLWAGSGGPSNCSKITNNTCSGTAKPAWQTGSGVPSDGVRDIPDVSFYAASGDSGSKSFYVICEADLLPAGYPSCVNSGGYVYYIPVWGTSAGAPTFAGAVALANQKIGHRLGNLNYLMYPLATQTGVFHDVAVGSNSVPCQGGTPNCSATSSGQTGVLVQSGNMAYLAASNYDRATGLGSPNISNLVTKLGAATFTSTATNLKLNGDTAPVTATHSQPITVGVTITPTSSTGAVVLLGNHGSADDSGIDSSSLSGGTANWTSTLFPGGTYTVHAHYPGDGTRGASDSSAISVNISPENSKTFVNLVTFDLNGFLNSFTASSAEYGSPYVLRMDVGDAAATISRSTGVSSKCMNGTASCPTGTMTVTANGNPLDSVDGKWLLNNAGHAEDQPIQLLPGNYNIVANYPGDASYNASSGTTSFTISKATTTTTGTIPSTVPYGTFVDISGTVMTNSNGAQLNAGIEFYFDGVQQFIGGSSAGIVPPPPYRYSEFVGSNFFTTLGDHTMVVKFPGDTNYAASSSATIPFTVVRAATRIPQIQLTPNPTTPQIPVTLNAQLTSDALIGTLGGSITYYDNGTAIGTVTITPGFGYSLNYTFSQVGTHNITASYSGDTNHLSSTSDTPSQLTVQQKLTPSTLALTAGNPVINQPTNIYAGLHGIDGAPAPTGTITFSDGGVALTEPVTYSSGGGSWVNAQITHTFTTTGAHNISAQYDGDANYTTLQSTPFALTVLGPFSLTPSSASATISRAGGTGTTGLQLQANGNFNGQVSFTCASVPATATCTVSPNPATLNGNFLNVTVGYTIPALAASTGGHSHSLWETSAGLFFAGMVLLAFPQVRRRKGIGVVVLALCIGFGLTSCGGGSSTPPPPPPPSSQTYTMTITATSGTSTETATLTVTER